jgi:D-alanyl-D-alanine carboxypeptidase
MTRHHRTALLLAGLLATAIAASCRTPIAEAPPDLQGDLDRIVAGGAPGVTAFVRNDNGSWSGASGRTSLEGGRPMGVDDHFRVGSITKMFIATVVLQLVAAGHVRLDDPVARWLPDLPVDGRITIEELLAHRSGLFDYADQMAVRFLNDPASRHTRWQPVDLVDLATTEPSQFPPGTQWAYSNTNYVVLGMLIEQVTGHSVSHEITDRIIDPLHLTDTSFPEPGDTTIPEPHPTGYSPTLTPLGRPRDLTGQDTTSYDPSFAWAAGALISTATDLARFLQGLIGGDLLPADSLTTMLRSRNDDPDHGYGLGLLEFHQAPCAIAVIGHNGSFPGFSADAYTSLDGHHQLAILINEELLPPPAQAALNTTASHALCP